MLGTLTHHGDHLVRVHRPLVEERHHCQRQRIRHLPLRHHDQSPNRTRLIEFDYIWGQSSCQEVRRLGRQARRRANVLWRPGSPEPSVTAFSKVIFALLPSSSRVATWFSKKGRSWVRRQVSLGALMPARRERRRPASAVGIVQARFWRLDFSPGRALRRGEQTAWWTRLPTFVPSNDASAR